MGKLKTRWQNVETKGYPERDNDVFYGDRYSVPVLAGNNVTGQVAEIAYMWDYNMLGWVEFGLRDGANPYDYGTQDVSHWAYWPKCKLVCTDN